MADVLEHIPSFGDLRASSAQVSAFEQARSELDAAGDVPAAEIELGAVVRLDRGFPMIATASGALLRAEHAVDLPKESAASVVSTAGAAQVGPRGR